MKSTAATPKGWLMPKALCLIGMVISILVLLIFLIDLIMGVFKLSNVPMDIVFIVAAAAIAFLSFTTFREQK